MLKTSFANDCFENEKIGEIKMQQLFTVNTFAEAMLYYSGRANNSDVQKRLADEIERCPENKEALLKIVSPVVELEKELDEKLNIDEKLVIKYFKKYEGRNSVFPSGFCLAYIMTQWALLSHIENSAFEISEYLRKCSAKEQMFSFCFTMADEYETVYIDECSAAEFMRRLNNLRISSDDKLEIMGAAFTYQIHIEELLSLIMPAAELIENAKNKYDSIIDNFWFLYPEADSEASFKKKFDLNYKPVDIMKVVPMLFGFDKGFGVIDSNDKLPAPDEVNEEAQPLIGRFFVGIAKHITRRSSKEKISALSEKMKALSDRTRLEILFYLCNHRAYGQELCAKFGLGHSAISYHVTKLLSAGFVEAENVGNQTYYEADKAGIQRMLDAFAEKIK